MRKLCKYINLHRSDPQSPPVPDFFQEIWQGAGYESPDDEDKDGIRDDFEIDHYGNLDKHFEFIMQENWSESRADAAGNAASGDAANWNKYWCDTGTLKGYQP
ncbi:MAG: hypothetical protein LC725_09690 [Lentisphaerae bacterium]|nr:hypothetical protein [Lentisphaerota bacterium]